MHKLKYKHILLRNAAKADGNSPYRRNSLLTDRLR